MIYPISFIIDVEEDQRELFPDFVKSLRSLRGDFYRHFIFICRDLKHETAQELQDIVADSLPRAMVILQDGKDKTAFAYALDFSKKSDFVVLLNCGFILDKEFTNKVLHLFSEKDLKIIFWYGSYAEVMQEVKTRNIRWDLSKATSRIQDGSKFFDENLRRELFLRFNCDTGGYATCLRGGVSVDKLAPEANQDVQRLSFLLSYIMKGRAVEIHQEGVYRIGSYPRYYKEIDLYKMGMKAVSNLLHSNANLRQEDLDNCEKLFHYYQGKIAGGFIARWRAYKVQKNCEGGVSRKELMNMFDKKA